MKGKIMIVALGLMMVLGIGCSGGKKAEPPTDLPVTGDQLSGGEGETVSTEEGDENEAAESDLTSVPANCTLDEVVTSGKVRRSISRDGELIASMTYEIDPEGIFVSINEEECSYEDLFFTETDTTLCHTNVPCGDRQYEYFVDTTNRNYPVWVVLDGDTRWLLGRFTGTLPPAPAAPESTVTPPDSSPLPERPESGSEMTCPSSCDCGCYFGTDNCRSEYRRCSRFNPDWSCAEYENYC